MNNIANAANIQIAKGKDVSYCLLAIILTTTAAVDIFLDAIDNLATKIFAVLKVVSS